MNTLHHSRDCHPFDSRISQPELLESEQSTLRKREPINPSTSSHKIHHRHHQHNIISKYLLYLLSFPTTRIDPSFSIMDDDDKNRGDLILVTGASGFIAKHTIQQALVAGYRVRGTVRDNHEASVAQEAVDQKSPEFVHKFTLVRADLTKDEGWKEAVQGCACVLHIAAPYPKDPIQDREALVPICRDGTLRVLRAAFESSQVQRVMMVSSIVAVNYWPNRPRPIVQLKESDWTDIEWKKLTWSYAIAKTKAEKAAWEFAKKQHAQDKLVSVNPAMVWGPLFDAVECTSSDMCKMFLQGALPLCPSMAYPIVDVRDVAALLVASIKAPQVGGRRLFASADTMNFVDLAKYLSVSFPQFASKIPTHAAPYWLLWLQALLGDAQMKQILPDLETRVEMNADYVTELTGVKFRPAREAVRAMVESLIDQNLV